MRNIKGCTEIIKRQKYLNQYHKETTRGQEDFTKRHPEMAEKHKKFLTLSRI